jgi:endonuclease-3
MTPPELIIKSLFSDVDAMKIPRKTAAQKTRAAQLFAALQQRYPDAHCALEHRNAFELLIATILSAQCTDERVNMVTPALFKRWPTPALMAEAPIEELEEAVRTTGFYHNKARALKETSQQLVRDFGGEVPSNMEALLQLRGVARKTANVVLGNIFGINEGIVVDTHVARLSQRLGLTRHKEPAKIERDLMALFPRENWTMLSHLLIAHGRACCTARPGTHKDNEICRNFGIAFPCQPDKRPVKS